MSSVATPSAESMLTNEWRSSRGVHVFPRPAFSQICLEVAAYVPSTSGSANSAGEDETVLFPPRPGPQPLGGLTDPVLPERIGDELGQGQRALAPLGLGVTMSP